MPPSATTTTPPHLTTTFPCTLTLHTPLPTPRLATIALQSLSIDPELSPLVQRSFHLTTPTTLTTYYSATTNRMLRVAVNGFFESLGVVLACMRELDGDVVGEEWRGEGLRDVDGLSRVQGLEERGVIGRYSEGAGVKVEGASG